MNTLELNLSFNPVKEETTKRPYSIYKRFAAFAESQTDNRAAWFLVSLLGQSVLFLPVPAALMYYYNAPIALLAITVLLFFANLIAGMGGSKIGVLIFLLGLSIITHLAMIMIFTI